MASPNEEKEISNEEKAAKLRAQYSGIIGLGPDKFLERKEQYLEILGRYVTEAHNRACEDSGLDLYIESKGGLEGARTISRPIGIINLLAEMAQGKYGGFSVPEAVSDTREEDVPVQENGSDVREGYVVPSGQPRIVDREELRRLLHDEISLNGEVRGEVYFDFVRESGVGQSITVKRGCDFSKSLGCIMIGPESTYEYPENSDSYIVNDCLGVIPKEFKVGSEGGGGPKRRNVVVRRKTEEEIAKEALDEADF